MDPRDILTQLVAMRGSNPMGGPQQFTNDIPMPGFVPQLPPGWQPPGQAPLTGVDPSGEWMPEPPPMMKMPIPRFHVPPGTSFDFRREQAI